MDISVSIDIKKRKLAYEYSKDSPNYTIIHRLKDSIRRHENDMRRIRRAIWRKKNRRNKHK